MEKADFYSYKNRDHDPRGMLDALQFDGIKFEAAPDSRPSFTPDGKIVLSKECDPWCFREQTDQGRERVQAFCRRGPERGFCVGSVSVSAGRLRSRRRRHPRFGVRRHGGRSPGLARGSFSAVLARG